jgi:hypothetical protein
VAMLDKFPDIIWDYAIDETFWLDYFDRAMEKMLNWNG